MVVLVLSTVLIGAILVWIVTVFAVLALLYAWGEQEHKFRNHSRQEWHGD